MVTATNTARKKARRAIPSEFMANLANGNINGVSTVPLVQRARYQGKRIKHPGTWSVMLRVDVALVSLTRYRKWLGIQISDSGSTRPANGAAKYYTTPSCPS